MPSVLITGASGFIGTQATLAFAQAGWDVHALLRPPRRTVPAGTVHVVDTTSLEDLERVLGATMPDVVVHLAATYVKDHDPEQVDALIEGNVTFGCRLLESMSGRCSNLVTAGTAWQHLNQDDAAYRPATLYAATKQAFEDVARWYCDARAMDVTALHLGDTYGPNDPRPKIYAHLASAADSGKPLALTKGEQLIDPLHVFDATAALRVAATRLLEGAGARFEVFRVTPGEPLPLKDLVATWCRSNAVFPDLRWGAIPYRDREVMRPWTGGVPLPGWTPTVGLVEGLKGVGFGFP